ncbi:MAG: hypothetical protein HRU38_23775 [Saccharospirillaceae bacterium]|nr:glycosyl hydrolase family 8 [Pseudomonadales bacterium]NRB81642.1 hypothetical protein [Saccharospirillaceae bacterium]
MKMKILLYISVIFTVGCQSVTDSDDKVVENDFSDTNTQSNVETDTESQTDTQDTLETETETEGNNTQGATETVTETETENFAPVASISVDTPSGEQAPVTVLFSAEYSTDDQAIVQYDWLINGQSFSDELVSYSFDEAQIYNIVLTVTDAAGENNTITIPFEVINPEPQIFRGLLPTMGEQGVVDEIKTQYDAWKEKYLVTRPGIVPMQKFVWYKVDERFEDWADNKRAVTVSEAHGYGMLILANMAAIDDQHDTDVKSDFDAMVNYLNSFPSSIDSRLMSWMQWTDGIDKLTGEGSITDVIDAADGDSAIDGDMDIAYALLIADKIWGSDGAVDYKTKALSVIHGILESTVHPTENVLLLGDWVNPNSSTYGKATRASDFMLQHLRVFAKVDVENSERWLQVLEKTIDIYKNNVNNFSNNTGLVADFLIHNSVSGQYEPSPANFLESDYDGDYYYNSARVPWRLAMDYLYGDDDSVVNELEILNNWIRTDSGNDPEEIYPGYTLNGNKLDTSYIDLTFSAPFVVSASIDLNNQQWVDDLWEHLSDQNNPVKYDFYFGNSIRLLSIISAGGQWVVP